MIALALSLVAGLAALAASFAYLLECSALRASESEQKILQKARAIQRAIL